MHKIFMAYLYEDIHIGNLISVREINNKLLKIIRKQDINLIINTMLEKNSSV